MRKRLLLVAAAAVLVSGGPGFAAGDEADLAATVKALKMRLKDQDRRIAELEAKQANQDETRRDAILAVLKDMNIDAEKRGNDLRLYWSNGIRMDSYNGDVKLKLGGRFMYDFGWIDGSGLEEDLGVDLEDGVDMRRARLYVSGKLYKTMEFKWQYDFAGGNTAAKDIYLKFLKVPLVGNVTIGHFKEPFSLEELTSSKYITFMERSLGNVFSPGRNAGVMAHNTLFDERMTWAVGLFRDVDAGDDSETNADGGYNLTGRVTAAPIYEDGGRRLAHVGASYSFRDPEDGLRYRTRPEAHFIPDRFSDTGVIPVNGMSVFGGEAAMVYGPFSLQGEYFGANVQADDTNDLCFNGFYVQASYFITGEHRPYKKSSGAFGRVKPKRNYGVDGGWGAWEVAGRYSYLDLGDDRLPSTATRVQNATVGLNWHLNPNMRLMWNYIRSCVDGEDISNAADIAMMRIQVDF